MSTNGDMPAMPQLHMIDGNWVNDPLPKHAGLTKREHACIALRVPETGDPELDALIRTAHRRDVAAMAMQGVLANPGRLPYAEVEGGPNAYEAMVANFSMGLADALLAALDASRPMEPKP